MRSPHLTSRRSPPWSRSILAAVWGVGLAACGSSGGNGKKDGGSDATTEHPADGGSDAGGAGGTGGGGTGGGGAGGDDAATDGPGAEVANPLCEGVAPALDTDADGNGIIADFNGTSNSVVFGAFGVDATATGGTYYSTALTEDLSANNWHLTGTIVGKQLMGLWWQCSLPTTSGGCTLNLSRFKGIRFTVKGNAGPYHALLFTLGRAENDPYNKNAYCGSCDLAADAGEEGHCVGPALEVPVPADGTASTVTVLWTDFHGGIPHDSIDPRQITGIQWRFHEPGTPDGGTGGASDASGGSDANGASDAAGGNDAVAGNDAADASGGNDAANDDAANDDAANDDAANDDAANDDAAAADGGTDGGVGADGGSADGGDDGPPAPSYPGDITIDDIVLVPY